MKVTNHFRIMYEAWEDTCKRGTLGFVLLNVILSNCLLNIYV